MSAKNEEKDLIRFSELFEEKRDYPRIKVNYLAGLRLDSGEEVNVIVHDISPDGMQLRCNRKTAKVIHPSGKFIIDKTAPCALINFNLSIGEIDKEIKVQCKLYYFTIISTDVVAFGAKFFKFEEFGARHVEKFIAQSLIPLEAKVLEILHKPQTSEDIMQQLDDDNIDLDDTLNMLRKKKAIVSYAEDKQQKYVRIETAIEKIFERLDKIEERLARLEKGK